ncbi:MAG: squalene--hopene cyclase [Verrucomicrobia bacterium]|nr:squalene--hopene cyclase [Verrucomicrobiota bacterium]
MVNSQDFLSLLGQAIFNAQQHLLNLQSPDGYWIGELMVDSTLCSDYVAFMHWAEEVDPELERKCVHHILETQLSDGGWNIYPEGPSEVNATVKAYFALKLAGFSPDDSRLVRARHRARELGGIENTNTYARLYLALLGQVPWGAVPTIPVEFLMLPRWSPVHLYAVSSWTRSMVVPLAVINHYKITRQLPEELGIKELYVEPEKTPRLQAKGLKKLFIFIDRCLKFCEDHRILPIRRFALQEAERWMIERIGDGNDGLAAIFPAMLNSMIALRCLGYSPSHPLYRKAEADFKALFVEDEKGFRIQPCFSPVWDTAITTLTLARSNMSIQDEPLKRAADWLAAQEVRISGDWAVRNPEPEPSGWCFEFNNPYNPDIDDTAMVLLSLRTAGYEPEDTALYDRGLTWLLSFQCEDGGWAAFDKDVTNRLLEHVPFADHNAILDPTCCNITARVLEVLATYGFTPSHPIVMKALRFLHKRQEFDGAWYGRWGVNYVYGTWQVLRGLRAIGMNMDEPWIRRGRDWLERHQNSDGGWGESCASYEDSSLRGRGKSTPSQTAWALMGLLSFHDCYRESIRRGVEYLLAIQNPDGSWDEDLITGTGFPKVFYLKYDMYRNNWPLMALSMYQQRIESPISTELLPAAAVKDEDGAIQRNLATSVSVLGSVPGFELLKEFITRLSHG